MMRKKISNFREKGCIYVIINTTNGKKYYGKTNDARIRLLDHYNKLVSDKHRNEYLQRSWNKYGKNCFKFKVIKYIESNNLRTAMEESLLNDFYKENLYNIYYSSDSSKMPEEVKERIKEAKLEYDFTDEHRDNISSSIKEMWDNGYYDEREISFSHTDETRKSMSENRQEEDNPFYGKEHTKQSKVNMSKYSSKKLNENKVKQINWLLDNTNKSQKEISNLYNIGQQTVSEIKRDIIWTYVDDQKEPEF